MTEVMTEVPGAGTRLRIDADRPFDRHAGDSVLRVLGHTPDGEPIFDAAYVEVDESEARVLAWLCRHSTSPQPEMLDRIAQEVQAAFGSKITGRDAHQIAQIVALAQREQLEHQIGGLQTWPSDTAQRLAERFERAAARVESPLLGSRHSADTQSRETHNGG